MKALPAVLLEYEQEFLELIDEVTEQEAKAQLRKSLITVVESLRGAIKVAAYLHVREEHNAMPERRVLYGQDLRRSHQEQAAKEADDEGAYSTAAAIRAGR